MLDLLFSEYRPYIQDVIAWTICCAAFVWGGSPERIIAATWLVLFELAGIAYVAMFGEARQLETIDWYFAGIDLIVAVIWITMALYANRNYTLWIAAMQLLAFGAHVSRGLIEVISPITYAIMVIAPGWLQLLFLAIGLGRHIWRKRKFGPYRDWRTSPASGDTDSAAQLFPDWLQGNRNSWRDELK